MPSKLYDSSAKFLRATALRTIAVHENKEHGGQVCWDERFNIAAFIAYSLGITASQLPNIEEALLRYEETKSRSIDAK